MLWQEFVLYAQLPDIHSDGDRDRLLQRIERLGHLAETEENRLAAFSFQQMKQCVVKQENIHVPTLNAHLDNMQLSLGIADPCHITLFEVLRDEMVDHGYGMLHPRSFSGRLPGSFLLGGTLGQNIKGDFYDFAQLIRLPYRSGDLFLGSVSDHPKVAEQFVCFGLDGSRLLKADDAPQPASPIASLHSYLRDQGYLVLDSGAWSFGAPETVIIGGPQDENLRSCFGQVSANVGLPYSFKDNLVGRIPLAA